MEERSKLTKIKAMLQQKLSENDFDLESISIEIVEDDNHIAHLMVKVLPAALMSSEEKDIEQKFKDIMGDL